MFLNNEESILPSIFRREYNCRKCDKILFVDSKITSIPFFVYEEDETTYKVIMYKGIQTFEILKSSNNNHIFTDKRVIKLLSNEHNTFIANKLETDKDFRKLVTINDIEVESLFVNFRERKVG